MNSDLANQYLIHLRSIEHKYRDAIQQSDNGKIPDEVAYGIITRARNAIEKITGRKSTYARQVLACIDRDDWAISYKAEIIIGLVVALREDIEDGFIDSLGELIRGEVFESYLSMAEYLLSEGYKDAAAVIAGSTLESHLRQLCVKHNISLVQSMLDGSKKPKKASQLNQDLAKSVYSQFDQKQIAAWLDLRNNAAHGHYSLYSADEVVRFLDWLRDFISKNPA